MFRVQNSIVSKIAYLALIFLAPFARSEGFKIPDYESHVLANGLKVYVMPQHEVPLLHVTVTILAGSSKDAKNFGLAALTSEALTLGTKTQSKTKIDELFDFHGAQIGLSANQDSSTFDLSLATKDAEKLLPFFADIIINPIFPDKEFIKLRERMVSALKKSKDSPNQVADQYFNRMIFEQHPYGHPVLGSPSSISLLQRDQLLKFHSNWYRPEQAAISIVGDLDAKTMKNLIEKSFSTWAPGKSDAKLGFEDNVPMRAQDGDRVLLINKEDATETTFRIGGMGVPRDNKDWIKLQVLNTILGGRFTSLLNEELRIKTGLTYGARSRFDAFKQAGTFAISSFTANDNTEKALDLAFKTYDRFVQEGVDQATLDSAKSYVKGQFPPRYETLEALSKLLLQLWLYKLPDSVINNFESEVDSLSLDQAKTLIRQDFPVKNRDILLIGQAKKIENIAKKYGHIIKAEINAVHEGRF
ncbi:MAG: pitrilysin family protein [Proteobacteria bacterium]|nr:pitrilysin family protein [Pseudomonadota bacterium]